MAGERVKALDIERDKIVGLVEFLIENIEKDKLDVSNFSCLEDTLLFGSVESGELQGEGLLKYLKIFDNDLSVKFDTEKEVVTALNETKNYLTNARTELNSIKKSINYFLRVNKGELGFGIIGKNSIGAKYKNVKRKVEEFKGYVNNIISQIEGRNIVFPQSIAYHLIYTNKKLVNSLENAKKSYIDGIEEIKMTARTNLAMVDILETNVLKDLEMIVNNSSDKANDLKNMKYDLSKEVSDSSLILAEEYILESITGPSLKSENFPPKNLQE